MSDEWFDRLREAIEASDKSMPEISIAAGRGRNYVQQMLKDRKQPGIENLLKILDALGSADAIYVLTGIRLTQETLDFVRMFEQIPDSHIDHALAVLRAMALDDQGTSSRPSDDQAQES